MNSVLAALTLAGRMQINLVLLDIVMSGINGIETLRALRSIEPALRICAMSLHYAAEYRTAALESGADAFISKHEFATAIPALIAAIARDNGIAVPSTEPRP